jgi:hypothetical protein
MHLHHMSLTVPLWEVALCKAPMLVAACNQAFVSEPRHANIWVAATKWSPLGNLVIFMGPETSLIQLQAAHHLIVGAIEAALPTPTPLSSHPNVKWSKLLINSMPHRVTEVLLAYT